MNNNNNNKDFNYKTLFIPSIMIIMLLPQGITLAHADGRITYDNIADDPGVGINYERTRSPEFATVLTMEQQSLTTPIPFRDSTMPHMTGGFPGAAIFDYDADGDLDIYITNGPDSANSLFQNQLIETSAVTFIDVANSTGVSATTQDSAGTCFGDIDNDGDHDLFVVGRHAQNILFENLGDGTFSEVIDSGLEGGLLWSVDCSFGDVDNDGFIDVVVANSVNLTDNTWVRDIPFALNEHNQLFVNNGDNTFTDESSISGIEILGGLAPEFAGNATITWATAMVDIDTDGDIDILFGDDQVGLPPVASAGSEGIDRGFIHVFINNGTGSFTDEPIILNDQSIGGWMGLSFGDLNCDGNLDTYATNFGSYATGSLSGQPDPEHLDPTSRWFLGMGNGTFTDPGVGSLISTPFGWGTAIYDYDNDGDLDILAHGGLDASISVVSDNPGTLHQNQSCLAEFVIDFDAIPDDPTCVDTFGDLIPNCTEHIRNNVRGVAVGDLDQNGFIDIVTVANVYSAPPLPLIDAPDNYGSVFDDIALFAPIFEPVFFPQEGLVWNGINPTGGKLNIELSSENDNNWVAVTVMGTIGTLQDGEVNRDGIGAVISFTPTGSNNTVMSPVVGGSSHLSQNSLEKIFGLGDEYEEGIIDVLWPGGLQNRYDRVNAGERIVFPEIPCDPAGNWSDESNFEECVEDALDELVNMGIINDNQTNQFKDGMKYLFEEIHEDAPVIISLVADDPNNLDDVYSRQDTISITFDSDTNTPGGTGVQRISSIDDMFTFTESLGEAYSGQWTAPDTFIIYIRSVDDAGPPIIKYTTVTPAGTTPILSADGTSNLSSATSPVLSGDFGSTTPSPILWLLLPLTDGIPLAIDCDGVEEYGRVMLDAQGSTENTLYLCTASGWIVK